MMRIADWEIEEPFNDVRAILKSNPRIRGRTDVEDALRAMIDAMKQAAHQLEVAIQKQIIEDAEATLTAARVSLASLEPSDESFPF